MTQLCLSIPALAGGEEAGVLTPVLTAAGVAAVVVMPRGAEALTAANAGPLVAAIQAAGAAALLWADAQLARVLKADGVHLPWTSDVLAAYEEARDILGRGAIVGVDAGRSRHDAMSLGENGADYVAFGDGTAADADERLDLVSWWSEIFEVPVVAWHVTTPEAAAELADVGADFVSTPVTLASAPAALDAFVKAIAPEPVA